MERSQGLRCIKRLPVNRWRAISALAVWCLLPVGGAFAKSATSLVEGQPTLGPLAFVRFCLQNQSECPAGSNKGRISLTPTRLRQLADLNIAVNTSIIPDDKRAGHLAWSAEAKSGDCNIFALRKRHLLLEKGWPVNVLSLAVVRLRSNTMHLVLVVRTDQGDLVLDNLSSRVETWSVPDYHWVSVQSVANPERWVEVENRIFSLGHRGARGEASLTDIATRE